MSLFIKKVVIQAIIIFCMAGIGDYIISSILKQSDSFAYGESYIWNQIYKGNIKDDLLIYGSSRAWVHFDPQIIQDSLGIQAYNLGIDGHNFWLQYLHHKKLLKYNKKPKVIILSVGLFSLNNRKDLYNLDQFLPFIFDKGIYQFTASYKGFSIFDYTIPLYRYREKREAVKTAFLYFNEDTKKEPYRIKGFRGNGSSME